MPVFANYLKADGETGGNVMKKKKKLLALSGSLLVLHSVSGCDLQNMQNYFAPDRRVPEDSTVDFGNRHSPLLNPGENGSGRKAPAENGSVENIPTIQKSPVVPVITTTIPSVTAGNANTASMQAADQPSYPSLTTVPLKPETPPKEKLKSELNSLTAEQKTTDSERNGFMHDSSATVLTSPQTGQLVDNPADAMPAANAANNAAPAETAAGAGASAHHPPQNSGPAATVVASDTESSTGFGVWLHNLFTADKKTVSGGTQDSGRKVPVENQEIIAGSSASPASSSGFLAPPASPASPPSLASEANDANIAPVLHPPVSKAVHPAKPQVSEQPSATSNADISQTQPLDSPPVLLTQPAAPAAMEQPSAAMPAENSTGAQASAPETANPQAPASPPSLLSTSNIENNFPVKRSDEEQTQEKTAKSENSEGGFGGWMHSIFGGSQKPDPQNNAVQPAEAQPVAVPVVTVATPAEVPASPDSAAATATATAAPVTVDLPPPAQIQQQPVELMAPASSAAAAPGPAPIVSQPANSLPSTSELSALPVQPARAATASMNAKPLPDISQLNAIQDERPVNLVQPDSSSAYSSDGYIGESRYAERRHMESN